MAFKLVYYGKVKDARSESEGSDAIDDDDNDVADDNKNVAAVGGEHESLSNTKVNGFVAPVNGVSKNLLSQQHQQQQQRELSPEEDNPKDK